MSGILLASVGNSYGSIPVNTVAPVVSGTAAVNQTLSTTNGTWTGAPSPTFTYQWQRNNVNISGATSSTYLVVVADIGNPIRCVVTATNSLGAVSANSNETANVVAGVPAAPTIGTATATGVTQATVSFTAPTNDGGSTITSYTATSSPGNITGTLNQAGSGTITVTGLTASTSYTFRVTATNSAGTSAQSAASNSITTASSPGAIGSSYQGGFYAGSIGVSSVATHYLVIAPLSSGQTTAIWKNARTTTPGADSVINGPQNTADMVADGNSTVYPAAHFCNNAVIGGFSDWYMPAKNELEVCYFNLKPTTTSNSTTSGINPNAVPARGSNYTAGTPAQTSAAAFQTGGAEAFSANGYSSSTEVSANTVWGQYFSNGVQLSDLIKDSSYRVRAVRRVAV